MTTRDELLEAFGLTDPRAICERVAVEVNRMAWMHGTPIVVWQDGRVVHLRPTPVVPVFKDEPPPEG